MAAAHDTYQGKNVIWESRAKQLWLIAVSLTLAYGGVVGIRTGSLVVGWGCLIFFGGGGLYWLGRLLNPANRFVAPGSRLAQEIRAEQFRRVQADLGDFIYSAEGFTLGQGAQAWTCPWSAIETAFGYKEDRYVVDEICLDLFTCHPRRLRLTESTPGWYQFLAQFRQHFPTVSPTWEIEIAQPPFAPNLTLLYDRAGRSFEAAAAACYPRP